MDTLYLSPTSLVRKSAPMVALYWLLNFLLTYWFMSEVFPTPLSPRMITFRTRIVRMMMRIVRMMRMRIRSPSKELSFCQPSWLENVATLRNLPQTDRTLKSWKKFSHSL